MCQILLWWWQSFFILRNLEYHINFGYTFGTETWPCILYGVLESYHLACVQIIGIMHAHLNYTHFNSVHLLWHWIGIDTHWIYYAISQDICRYISVTIVFQEYGYRNGIVIFLAATKQLYKWYFPSNRLSVRPSVCPSVCYYQWPK